MPVCGNPTQWNKLVKGTKYEAYRRGDQNAEPEFTGWFSRNAVSRRAPPKTQLIFRLDAADPMNLPTLIGFDNIKHDPNGEYKLVDPAFPNLVYCAVEDQPAEPVDVEMGGPAPDNGGRRSKTRASQQKSLGRFRSRRRLSQRRRAKSRRQQRT